MKPLSTTDREARPRPLSAFIRERQRELLTAWERQVRELPITKQLDHPALLDHIPQLLQRIAEIADELVAGARPSLPFDLAELHALARLDEGFDLAQVVWEYSVLRDCIVRLWTEQSDLTRTDSLGVRAVNQAIDKAVAASVQRYTQARDHTLQALDRISAAALEARSLDEFLDRLLRVLLETTAAVDTAAILLRDGDFLRIRASVGLEQEVATGFAVRVGEGFAGLIAQTQQPHHVHNAATDPLVLSPSLQTKGVKGLFGVPLVDGGSVIGVAHMGSLTTHEFSAQDRWILSALAHRATTAIFQHMLRDAAERRAVQQEAVASLGARARSAGDVTALLDDAVATVTQTLGVEMSSALALDGGMLMVEAESGWGRDVIGTLGVPATERWPAGFAAVTGQPAIVEDAGNETRFDLPPEFAERGVLSAIAVVIPAAEGRVYGVLAAHSLRRRAFVAEHIAFLESCAHVLGTALTLRNVESERARLLQQEQAARAEAERALTVLSERELQFRALADNIPQLAWMADASGTVIWINERWSEFTGRPSAEVIADLTNVHHPDHVTRVTAKFRDYIATGQPWEDTFPLLGKDGRYRWFLSRAVPIRNVDGHNVSWFGTNTDITEQRFMSEAIAVLAGSLDYKQTLEQVARLAVPTLGDWCAVDLVENGVLTRVAVTHTDPAKVRLAHEIARKYPSSLEAEGGVAGVIRTGTPLRVAEITDEMLVQGARDREHLELARELGLRSYMIAPLIARGRILGTISLVSAESGRRYSERDLEHAAELGRSAGLAIDNARLYENARRETRNREDLLAVVSHDLKNPLSTIHLATETLLDHPDRPGRGYLEKIHRASTRMDHLINDLLEMANIQTGHLSLERKPEDADLLVREAVELHEPMANEKGIALVREPAVFNQIVSCDRERMLQVFGNLLGNAIKFCSAGDQITVRSKIDHANAVFEVANTGTAIPENELPHLFEAYWSGKAHAKHGTGLGLYISKGIIEAQGGRIWATSSDDKGTTFSFTVPFARPE